MMAGEEKTEIDVLAASFDDYRYPLTCSEIFGMLVPIVQQHERQLEAQAAEIAALKAALEQLSLENHTLRAPEWIAGEMTKLRAANKRLERDNEALS
jgi:hypothetical protein